MLDVSALKSTIVRSMPLPADALLAAAEARGLRRFTADILADNRPMLRVLDRLADVRRRELNADVLTIEFERRRASLSGTSFDDVTSVKGKGGSPMLKIMAGTTVALASVGLLLLGACTTTGLRELDTSSASPPTSIEPGPKLDEPFNLSEFPQTL